MSSLEDETVRKARMVRVEDALAVAGVSLFHRLCDFLITSVNIQSAL